MGCWRYFTKPEIRPKVRDLRGRSTRWVRMAVVRMVVVRMVVMMVVVMMM
jgi:hypothetical protein